MSASKKIVESASTKKKREAVQQGPVVQKTKGEEGKAYKEQNPPPQLHKGEGVIDSPKGPPIAEPPAEKKSRKLADLPPEQLRDEINQLLADLLETSDQDEKKRIRRALRARGHRGGSNAVKANPSSAPAPKKGKRMNKAA